MQLANFSHVHFVAGGWYLDCSRGFVPDVEESFYNNLVTSTPEVIELEEEPKEENPAPQSIHIATFGSTLLLTWSFLRFSKGYEC